MNKFKLSPYVTYQFYGTLSQLYEFINKHNIVVYAIDISDNIHFKIHIMDEYKIYHNKKCSRVTYDGLIGLFIRQILNIRRLIGIIVFIYVIYILRNVCFEINIISDSSKLENMINEEVKLLNYYIWDNNRCYEFEELLRVKYFDVIEWINISKVGSYIGIEVKERVKVNPKENSYNSLYSYKDGVIASFDVKSGNKLVLLDQRVKIGDELVTSNIMDSSGNIKQTYVLGKVYAYTYTEITKVIKWPYSFDLTKPWAFYNLLYECREDIAKELSYDEKIIDENILQFYYEEGTISMKILYTLYEDITHP